MNYSLDIMKFFSAICVVYIHTKPFYKFGSIGIIINSLCRIAVPLFFICSGYLFYKKCSKGNTIKSSLKMLKLFTTWSLFYILFSFALDIIINFINNKEVFLGVSEKLLSFKLSDIYYGSGIIKYHLWYLSSMIFIYPILYLIISKSILNKAILPFALINIAGVFLVNLGVNTRDVLFFGLFYCLVGAYISLIEKKIKSNVKLNIFYYIGIIIFAITTILERFLYETYFSNIPDYYISTIPLSIMIFVICIIKKRRSPSILSTLGKNSLRVYLMHPAYMSIVNAIIIYFDLKYLKFNIYWNVFYTPILILISYLRIPRIKTKNS